VRVHGLQFELDGRRRARGARPTSRTLDLRLIGDLILVRPRSAAQGTRRTDAWLNSRRRPVAALGWPVEDGDCRPIGSS